MNRFATIVADPPWEVKAGRPLGDYVLDGGRQLFGARGQRARNTKYPSMTVAEIAALPVANIAADDSHLYLWTINRYLDDAFASRIHAHHGRRQQQRCANTEVPYAGSPANT